MKKPDAEKRCTTTYFLSSGTVFIFLAIAITAPGQTREQKRVDSLLSIASSKTIDTVKVMALYNLAIYYRRNDPQKALSHAEEGLRLAQKLKWKKGEADCLKNLGNTYHLLSDFPKERECFEMSLRIFEEIHDRLGIAKCLNNLGMTYYYLSDFPKALEYYQRSLKIMEEFGNKQGIANSLNNIGGVYDSQSDYHKALEYYERTLKIKEQLGDKTGIAICLTNIGNRYRNLADYPRALTYYQKSLKISEEIRDKPGMAASLGYIGDVYNHLGAYRKALGYSTRALQLAKSVRVLNIQRDALKIMSEAYDNLGEYKKSLDVYKNYVAARDSIISEDKVRQMNLASMKIQYARKHTTDSLAFQRANMLREISFKESLNRKNSQRNVFILSSLCILVITAALWSRLRYTRRSKTILQKEKDRSDSLLLNILPSEIAQELKENGKAEARDFEQVTVLFADIENFTGTSENLTAHELVAEINICFGAFDDISSRYRVEKIKTIGDCYMAAGGVPMPYRSSARNTVRAALKMQEFMVHRMQERSRQGLTAFEMRLGVHTGPVVAGIVGVNKFHYDIWGDTVNTASRMESSGVVEKVNISQSTYACLKDDPDFGFECRGRIIAKNKGEMEMYFVKWVGDPDAL